MPKMIRISNSAHRKLVELQGTTKFSLKFLADLAVNMLSSHGLQVDNIIKTVRADVEEKLSAAPASEGVKQPEPPEIFDSTDTSMVSQHVDATIGDDVDFEDLLTEGE